MTWFSRIQRFQQTRTVIEQKPSPNWATLALNGILTVAVDLYSTHLGFAADLTAGRARALVAAVVG